MMMIIIIKNGRNVMFHGMTYNTSATAGGILFVIICYSNRYVINVILPVSADRTSFHHHRRHHRRLLTCGAAYGE